MCYNLGADPSVQYLSATAQAAHTTPADVYGDLYQWGRIRDGHEKRNSECLGAGPSGVPCGTAANFVVNDFDTNGQPSAASGGIGLFIRSTTTPWDWRMPQTDTLWNRGTETAPIKTIGDPCPAGWRIPTQREWVSIYRDGAASGTPAQANVNTWTWQNVTGGTQGMLIAPSSSGEPPLFLPSTGYRWYNSGIIFMGTDGIAQYWSSHVSSDNRAYNMRFYNESVNTNYLSSRAYGNAVRCVAE